MCFIISVTTLLQLSPNFDLIDSVLLPKARSHGESRQHCFKRKVLFMSVVMARKLPAGGCVVLPVGHVALPCLNDGHTMLLQWTRHPSDLDSALVCILTPSPYVAPCKNICWRMHQLTRQWCCWGHTTNHHLGLQEFWFQLRPVQTC